MPWQTIEQRVESAKQKTASIGLVVRSEGGRPSCVIGLRRKFAETVTWKHGDPVGIQIGEGEHAGLLRLMRLKKDAKTIIASVRVMNKGGMVFDFGHIPQLGDEPHGKAGAEARLIDADTIEIVIPAWNDASAEADDELARARHYRRRAQAHQDDDEDERPRATTPAKPAAPQVSRPLTRVNGATLVQNKGVKLDLTAEEENVSFGGKTMDLTTRQAAVLAAVLLRVSPSFVGRSFILNSALADVPQHTREASLDLMVSDLTRALAGIGLALRSQKGVGLALKIGE